MKDFELLDNSIVEWNNEHDFPFHDLENINQVLKRKKLSQKCANKEIIISIYKSIQSLISN